MPCHKISAFMNSMKDWLAIQRGTARDVLPTINWPEIIRKTIIDTLVITAFFVGIEYFSQKPALDYRAWGHGHTFYRLDKLADFYSEHAIPIPSNAEIHRLLGSAEKHRRHLSQDQGDIGAGMSPLVLLEKLRDEPEAYGMIVQHNIKQIEKMFDGEPFRRRVYTWSGGGGVAAGDFREIREMLKQQLSAADYANFVLASVASRESIATASFSNDGDVSLSNLTVAVKKPISPVDFESLDVVVTEFMGQLSHVIDDGEFGPRIRLPVLQPGESFMVNLQTEQVSLSTSDLWVQYDAERSLRTVRIPRFAIPLFLGMFALHFTGAVWRTSAPKDA
jgi:hypothetical protein